MSIDSKVESISASSFGNYDRFVLDVDSWQQGEEIDRWDKSLLYPASALFK